MAGAAGRTAGLDRGGGTIFRAECRPLSCTGEARHRTLINAAAAFSSRATAGGAPKKMRRQVAGAKGGDTRRQECKGDRKAGGGPGSYRVRSADAMCLGAGPSSSFRSPRHRACERRACPLRAKRDDGRDPWMKSRGWRRQEKRGGGDRRTEPVGRQTSIHLLQHDRAICRRTIPSGHAPCPLASLPGRCRARCAGREHRGGAAE